MLHLYEFVVVDTSMPVLLRTDNELVDRLGPLARSSRFTATIDYLLSLVVLWSNIPPEARKGWVVS